MSFSNKKEDVIYMELTPYGRQLLSRGQLKPAYYSFFDDDVLYDISSVSTSDTSNYSTGFLSESNGEIKERILLSTPYLKPNISFVGRDKKMTSIQNYYLYEDLYKMEEHEKMSFLNYPLGTSNSNSATAAPCWDVKYLHGTASSTEVSTGVYSLNTKKFLDSSGILSSSLPYKNIPQIDFDINYEMSIRNVYTDDDMNEIEYVSPNLQLTETAADGTYISLKESPLLLFLREQHAFRSGEAFSVEVYKRSGLDENRYEALKFANDNYQMFNQMVVDDMLVDFAEEDADLYGHTMELDSSYVEYYFDLRLDSEIPEDDICTGLKFLKREDIFVDIDIECLERDAIADIDLYATRVTDIEEC